VRERQPFGGPLLVSFGDGRAEQAIGGRLAHAMRVQLDHPADTQQRARREPIVAPADRSHRAGGSGRREVSA
jgi:hypothetical protein